MNSFIYFVIVMSLTGFVFGGSVRGSENIQKSNNYEFVPNKVSAGNTCMVPHQLPIGSGASGEMLYLFNEKSIKIAKLADLRNEKRDEQTFFRLLFNVTIDKRDITNQIIGTRYFLNNLKVENYKYKFSKSEVDSFFNDITECNDLRFNVTYTKINERLLCQKAKDYINSKIDNTIKDYSNYITFNGDSVRFGSSSSTVIQKQDVHRVKNVMMKEISLDLNYFNSLYLYILQENHAVAVIKDYYYYYTNNNNNLPTISVKKDALNTITDIEEIRKFSYSQDNIQCTQLKRNSAIGYCLENSGDYPIAYILAYGSELNTGCIYYYYYYYYVVTENTVKSRTESYITQRINNNLNDIYTYYYKDLEECYDMISNVESLKEINLKYENKDERDYGSYYSNNYYLTNKYIAFIVKGISHNGNLYYQRLVYNIILNDDECNPTIKITSLNNTLSTVFFSDSFRYKEMTEDKKLEFKYYSCEYIYYLYYYSELSVNKLNYTEYCKEESNIIHSESNCDVIFTDTTITLKCNYINSESDNNEVIKYDISFFKHEDGSKGIDRIVSSSITSYPIPMKKSFIWENDNYFSGDYFIGSITDSSSNALEIEISYDQIKHYSNYSSFPYDSYEQTCFYMKPSVNNIIYSTSCDGSYGDNSFPLIGVYGDSNNVTFISKDQEYEIMKNSTLNQLNTIYSYNSKLDLTGQSEKSNGKDNKYDYLVLLSENQLSVIYSYRVGDYEFDSYKLIYNIADVNGNPYTINVTGLDYDASSFKLSNETCFGENIENDDNRDTKCGKNEIIYSYRKYVSLYEKLNETIFNTPFIINIDYAGKLSLKPDDSIEPDELSKLSDLIVNIYQKDKNEIERKIKEPLRTFKMKDHTNGIYYENYEDSKYSIHFAGVSPGYLFSFSYSDGIDGCEVKTTTINKFIEDNNHNVTTFDTLENTDMKNIFEFCFSANFENNNVFCGDDSYNGNILIDEYVENSLFLLPIVTYSSIRNNMSLIIDKCSSNFKELVKEESINGNKTNNCVAKSRLLSEDELLVNVNNYKSKNIENSERNMNDDTTTPDIEYPAINQTFAGYYENTDVESTLPYDYYGVFLTNTEIVVDLKYKSSDNIRERKYVYSITIYEDTTSLYQIQVKILDKERSIIVNNHYEEKSFKEYEDENENNKKDKENEDFSDVVIYNTTNRLIMLKNVGTIGEVNLTRERQQIVLSLSIITLNPKPIPKDISFYDMFMEDSYTYYVYKVYSKLFVQSVYNENNTYILEFGSGDYIKNRQLLDVRKISGKYALLQDGGISRTADDNKFSAKNAIKNKKESKDVTEVVREAESKTDVVSNEVKNEINSIPTKAPANEPVVKKEKSVGGNGIALIVIFTLLIIVVVAFVIVAVFVPAKYYSKYFNKSKVDEGDKPTYDPVETFNNPAEVETKPIETKPVEDNTPVKPKLLETKPVEETLVQDTTPTEALTPTGESKPTDEVKPTEESKPTEEVKPNESN